MVTAKRAKIDQDVDQGIATCDRRKAALAWTLNAEGFGLTVDAFGSRALGVEGLVVLRMAVKAPAQEVAEFDIHFADSTTGGTAEALQAMSVLDPVFLREHLLAVAGTPRPVMGTQHGGGIAAPIEGDGSDPAQFSRPFMYQVSKAASAVTLRGGKPRLH
jgi:hypothetical protein